MNDQAGPPRERTTVAPVSARVAPPDWREDLRLVFMLADLFPDQLVDLPVTAPNTEEENQPR